MSNNKKYKPLPVCQSEKEALQQIRRELSSDMDETIANTPKNAKKGQSGTEEQQK